MNIDEAHSRSISAHALAKSRGEWADTLQAEIKGFKTALSDADALLVEALPHLRESLVPWHAHRGLKCSALINKIEAAIGSTTEREWCQEQDGQDRCALPEDHAGPCNFNPPWPATLDAGTADDGGEG